MPPANQPPPEEAKRREDIHRAGVQYQRPGRVGKASPKRA